MLRVETDSYMIIQLNSRSDVYVSSCFKRSISEPVSWFLSLDNFIKYQVACVKLMFAFGAN